VWTPAPASMPTRLPIFSSASTVSIPLIDRRGAGLGLSLAKWIVDRHHGRIELQSAPGRGSTFTLWRPV
jgi:signal transduction histidine kinase